MPPEPIERAREAAVVVHGERAAEFYCYDHPEDLCARCERVIAFAAGLRTREEGAKS